MKGLSKSIIKNKIREELENFSIPYRKTLNLPKNVTFGLELEFRMKGFDNSYKINFMDDDEAAKTFLEEQAYDYSYDVEGEISNHIELVSPILTDTKETWEELSNILDFINNNDGTAYYDLGLKKYVTCGAHVHVGKNIYDKNNDGWLNFFKIWSIFERDIFTFTNGEYFYLRENAKDKARRINCICEKILQDYKRYGEIDFSYLSGNKMNCINFPVGTLDIYEKDKARTCEFRGPNGTTNKVIWQNNVNFFTKLLLSCADKNFDGDKLNYLYKNRSKANVLEFSDLIFNDELDKKCFLRQYYKDFSDHETGYSAKFWK